MNILVTGGSGFIGAQLVRRLILETTARVANYDKLTYAAQPDRLQDLAEHPRYRFLQADVCDAPRIARAVEDVEPDLVFHLAAETHVDRSITSAAEFIETNIVGTQCLLEATTAYHRRLDDARRAKLRVVHVSTDEVYGSLGPQDPPFTESTPYAPRSPYAASKAAADHLVRAWHHTHGLPTIITNCSNNYGPQQHSEKLIPLCLSRALAGQPMPIYGRGDNVRDWIHVLDHVAALRLIAERGRVGATYHVGAEQELRNIDLVRKLCGLLDELREPPVGHASHADLIQFVDDRPGHDFRYAMNTLRIRTELGWQPQIDVEQGLRELVEQTLGQASVARD